jgi:hypothetical protein
MAPTTGHLSWIDLEFSELRLASRGIATKNSSVLDRRARRKVVWW